MFERAEVHPRRSLSTCLDGRLRDYLAATSIIGVGVAQQSQAAVVSNSTVQPFGINGDVNIDFNSDGQIDFQIDHDRYDLNGNNLDYLQVDKNDVNSAANPLPINNFVTFPTNNTTPNGDTQYLSFTNSFGDPGGYAVGLKAGDAIGATGASSLIEGTLWDFQEGTNFAQTGTTIRANRLIDEDQGQIDVALAGTSVTLPLGPQPEYPLLDDFIGVGGAVRYLGVRTDLNDSLKSGLNAGDQPAQWTYGWIGLRITNEADATGEVVGWGYQTTPGQSILAGEVGIPVGVPGDYNGDHVVNAADFTIWRDTLGSTTDLRANGDNAGASAGVVDQADFEFWKTRFGNTSGSGGLAGGLTVPEPGSILLAVIGGCLLLSRFIWRKLSG